MRARWSAVGLLILVGCTPEAEKPPPDPLPTDGANQVVIYVPTMVCETCPDKVTEALTMLAWVEKDSIRADRKARQVRFKVTDRAAFDLEAVRETVSRKGFKGVKLLTGPTES